MVQKISKSLFFKYEQLHKELKKIIYGQDEAIDDIIDALIAATYKPAKTPLRAIFTFLGPPAVGKTYLAESLVALLEELDAFKVFDMGQYTDPLDVEKLIGKKNGGDGELPFFLKNHPRSVVVFDDIERSDVQIQLALLDFLTASAKESGLDLSGTIVIFSSTLGSALYQSREFLESFKKNKLHAQALIMDHISKEKKAVYDIIQSAIAPKLLSVMAQNTLVLFERLGLEAITRIGADAILELAEHFLKKSGLKIEFRNFESLVTILTLSFAPYINAKRVRVKLPDLLFYQITQYLRSAKEMPQKIVFDLSAEVLGFLEDLGDKTDLAQRLFRKNETVEIEFQTYKHRKSVTFFVAKAFITRPLPSLELYKEERPGIEFSTIGFGDIAGQSGVKKTLRQIMTILKEPGLAKKFDIPMPKGLLLYGPAGVGKTMLAKATANEAELPLVTVAGSDLFDPVFIKMAYLKAREYAPSIVFLDEIDTKGIIEGAYANMPADQLVLEIDSLPSSPDEFVFTIATARNKEEINPLIIESGRIDIFVEVPELDREARRFFIEKILQKPNDGKIDIDKVVHYISGMSGYDLQRIGTEASLYAILNNLDLITEEIIIEQINNIKYGTRLEKKQIRNIEEDLKKSAYHEAAHAVLSSLLLPEVKIEQVTITPRAQTLGFVSYTTEETVSNVSKEEIMASICVALAGRIAKIKKFGTKGLDSGAVLDLEQATYQAYIAIATLGMDEEIGYVHIDTLLQNVSKELFKQKIEERIKAWIDEARTKTEALVQKHWTKIEQLARLLIKKEIISGSELEQIMKRKRVD